MATKTYSQLQFIRCPFSCVCVCVSDGAEDEKKEQNRLMYNEEKMHTQYTAQWIENEAVNYAREREQKGKKKKKKGSQ